MRLAAPIAIPALALVLSLGACSSRSEDSGTAPAAATDEAAPVAASAAGATTAPHAALDPSRRVLGLEGLGDLRIGQPVPERGNWAEHGAQISDTCHTVTSPDYPGVYAIVSNGKVRRITIGQRSDVKLAEGIGVGASEQEVRKWFAGFRETPHKYEAAPAKYLTAPNAESGDPALRFEIGHDGKVSLIHVGTMPQLGYVEGCA